jgi:hypothetical protein
LAEPNLLLGWRLYLRKLHIYVDILGPSGVDPVAKKKEQSEQDKGTNDANDHGASTTSGFDNGHTITAFAHLTSPAIISSGQIRLK